MSIALVELATNKFKSWKRWRRTEADDFVFNPVTHVQITMSVKPDHVTERWDGITGVRAATAQELQDDIDAETARITQQVKDNFDSDGAAIRILRALLAEIIAEDRTKFNTLLIWLNGQGTLTNTAALAAMQLETTPATVRQDIKDQM